MFPFFVLFVLSPSVVHDLNVFKRNLLKSITDTIVFKKIMKQVAPLNWTEVQGWAGAGGARLRTTRSVLCLVLLQY